MLFLYRLLRRKKYRAARRRPFDPANPPKPLRWRPKLKIYGLVTGTLGGLGAVVLIAQYGISPVTSRALSTRGIAGGAISGIVMPSLIFALVVWRFNAKLARLGLHPRKPRPQLPSPAAAAAIVWLIGCVSFVLLLAVRPAAAWVDGPCTASFAGLDATGDVTSAGDRIEVPEDGAVSFYLDFGGDLASARYWLEYGPYQWVIVDGTDDGDDSDDDDVTDFGSAVNTEDFAWMGVGLYVVRGETVTESGVACSMEILIDVEGNPLATVLGATAAGATSVGMAGAAAVALGGLRQGGEVLDQLEGIEELLGSREAGPVDLDGDGVADVIDTRAPPLFEPDGRPVPINANGEAFTWDGDGWRWMPRAEAEALIAADAAASSMRAAERDEFLRETQRVMDDWMAERVRTNEIDAAAERAAREQMQSAWDRYTRMQNAALANDMYDVLDRLADDETIFDADGNLDVDYLDRMQSIMRNREQLEQLAPDPIYGEVGETIVALDEVSQHVAVRIAAGMATGGVSEIWYQGRGVVEAVADAAGDSTEWVQDPRTGTWVPPGEFGALDGLRVAADRIATENIPGYNTAQTLLDPNATWSDVAGAAAWDAVGAQLARGELAEAMDQVRSATSTLSGGRVNLSGSLGDLRGVGSAADLPTIRSNPGDVIAPPPYTDRFLPQFRETDSALRGLRPGEAIPNSIIHQTGMTSAQVDQLQNFANTHQVGVDVRTINVDSMQHLQNGAHAKPVELKPKTLKPEDYYLGACDLEDIGKVGMYDPANFTPRPIPADAPPGFAQQIEQMRATRASEISHYSSDVNGYLAQTGGRIDGAVLKAADGKPFAGDIDGVRFVDPATGQTITDPARYEQLKAAWEGQPPGPGPVSPLGQHGMESHVPSDVVDAHFANAPRGEPIPAEQFVAAQNSAWENAEALQTKLITNRLDGKDIVVGVMPGGSGLSMSTPVTADELRLLGQATAQ